VARIPYADPDRPEVQDIVRRITAERGSVLHLYRMLLHSPPIAAGWLACFTAIRQQSSLPGDLRELVIMRIAIVNGASYEAEQHAPIALREGLTQAARRPRTGRARICSIRGSAPCLPMRTR